MSDYNLKQVTDGPLFDKKIQVMQELANNQIITSSRTASTEDVLTIDDILSLEQKEEEWLVQSLVLSQGINLYSGLPNHFKSLFVQMLVKAVASGKDFLKTFETKQGAVLIIDREIPTRRLRTRWTTIGDLHGLSIYFYPYSKSFKLDNPKDMAFLKQLVQEKNIKLVVIDTFNRSHTGKEINSASEVAQLFDPLKTLLEYTTIILIHHSNKSGYKNEVPKPDELLGSIDFGAEVDLLFTLRKKDKNTVVVHNLKAKDSEMINPFQLTFVTYPEGKVDLLYEGEESLEESAVEQRINIIQEFLKTGRKKKAELLSHMEKLGYKEGTINNTLTVMRNKKLIASVVVGQEAEYFALDENGNEISSLPETLPLGNQETVGIVLPGQAKVIPNEATQEYQEGGDN